MRHRPDLTLRMPRIGALRNGQALRDMPVLVSVTVNSSSRTFYLYTPDLRNVIEERDCLMMTRAPRGSLYVFAVGKRASRLLGVRNEELDAPW